MQFIGNIEALIIRIGSWGPVYYNSNKEPPKIVLVTTKACIKLRAWGSSGSRADYRRCLVSGSG